MVEECGSHLPVEAFGSSLKPKAPEIQTMYSLNIPVSEVRTKIRQEFERHRYVNQLPVVDMLIFRSDSEFQVCLQLQQAG